jgi:GTP-binding protein YchF
VNVALVGLPLAGKTCLFTALSQGSVDSAANPARPDHPNAAMVAMPDERLEWLCEHYQTKKRTPVQMELLDLPGLNPGRPELASQNTAIMEYLRRADALVCVLMAFESSRVPGKVDPKAERDALHAEFVLSDLDTTLRRIEKLEKQVTKPVADREALKKELEFLGRCREALEAEKPLQGIARTGAERNILKGFASLTEKPILTALNVGEGEAGKPAEAAARYAGLADPMVALCASLEAEIAVLPPADRASFMGEMGLDRLHSPDVILGLYQALGRITFFTAGEKEVAARSVLRDASAVDAAGEVHTDMAKGFVRAEVVAYEDFKRAGSLKDARAAGGVRMEGRDYVVKDGDIIVFHFTR